MKKVIKLLIIIFVITLIGQLVYYNILKENSKEEIITTNIITSNNINILIEDNYIDIENVIITKKEDFLPENFDRVERFYTGEIDSEEIRKAIEKFVRQDIQKINNITSWKDINYVLQYYDINKEEVNKMNIYSAEDFREISRQIKLLEPDDVYKGSWINQDSFNYESDEYTTFTITLQFDNDNNLTSYRNIELKVAVANSSETKPNIKLSGVNNE